MTSTTSLTTEQQLRAIASSLYRRLDTIQVQVRVLTEQVTGTQAPPTPTPPGESTTLLTRPRIVCLCGSTRFASAFTLASRRLSLEGNIVVTIDIDPPGPTGRNGEGTRRGKTCLNALHRGTIDLADEVLVLNAGGTTSGDVEHALRREIAYATALNKPVYYLVDTTTSTADLPDDWWTTRDVLTFLASAGTPITRPTWTAYVSRGQAPKPERVFGSSPVWNREDIRAWQGTRLTRAAA